MKKLIIRYVPMLFLSVFVLQTQAQVNPESNPSNKIYRPTATKINSLVHTKLDVRFDYGKQYMYGKAWITLKPYAYATDSLRLDAKGMDINNISIVKSNQIIPLKYSYDSLQLRIILDKSYKADEQYTVFVDYTSKPNELKTKGSAAITDAKGLYFINPDSAIKGKPVQIWTQGETEASSVWFPTIDKPNQKTTSEIIMTVPSKYVTLSNGRLVSQKSYSNSTRTDTWKMDLPHSPYLFMMAVGDFKIYKDKWKDKEVNYYLEPAYAPYAKQIFGFTPEMIDFFSKRLGVDYPWNKYSQIVVRDYVSGAMENTTATLHGEFVQQTPGEMIDGSAGEAVIAHELFHQWFGDYVTAESWSNITVNESFANFSEVLWDEFKHGQDAGDYGNYEDMQNYLSNASDAKKDLVRFNYTDKEDVFDLVSYQKGGRILNMLRDYLGEDVFFKGLNIYLKQNAFKNGEAHQLRLELEEASGKDLNWFFNQWYFNNGHPLLKIDYKWDAAAKKQTVYLKQTQDGEAFMLPVAIDFYAGGKMERHEVWMNSKADTFTYSFAVKPDLVNVDAKKILLAEKTDSKTLNEYVFQYFNAPLLVDRMEAITEAEKKQDDPAARKVMIAALNDKFFRLRMKAIASLDIKNPTIQKEAAPILAKLVNGDSSTLVQAAAIKYLAKSKDSANLPIFKKAFESKSYSVQAAALNGIAALDSVEGLRLAKSLEKGSKGAIKQSVVAIYSKYGGPDEFAFAVNEFDNASVNEKFQMIQNYFVLLGNMNDTEVFKTNFNKIVSIIEKYKAYGVGKQLIPLLTELKDEKLDKAKKSDQLSAQLALQADIVKKVIEDIQNGK